LTRPTHSRTGVDRGRVGDIHLSLANKLAETFGFRSGKAGAPLLPIGHYAGLIDLGGGQALALHTDGVGSKVLIAQKMRKFDTVGIDCIAMTVNDLVCLGAEPVALLDYIALEKDNADLVSEICKGLVEGARASRAPIVGGETAILGEMVRGWRGNGFDLVSMGVGLVDKRELIDGRRIEAGDAVLGVESSGLHSNGYTLARKILRRIPLQRRVDAIGSTLGEALLTPTSIYAVPTLRVASSLEVHGIGHITGGAFTKLSRLAGTREITFELELPEPPPLFRLLQRLGSIPAREMLSTFNMGIGMCIVLPPRLLGRAARLFARSGFATHELGEAKKGRGVVVNGTKLN
jgi:phosphoribosylformylglycinamidine cyclo-ligase